MIVVILIKSRPPNSPTTKTATRPTITPIIVIVIVYRFGSTINVRITVVTVISYIIFIHIDISMTVVTSSVCPMIVVHV